MTQQGKTDPTNRLRRDSPEERRGLPGYPKERDGERARRQVGDELGFDPDSPTSPTRRSTRPGRRRSPPAATTRTAHAPPASSTRPTIDAPGR